jgi:hypothetical protein
MEGDLNDSGGIMTKLSGARQVSAAAYSSPAQRRQFNDYRAEKLQRSAQHASFCQLAARA